MYVRVDFKRNLYHSISIVRFFVRILLSRLLLYVRDRYFPLSDIE